MIIQSTHAKSLECSLEIAVDNFELDFKEDIETWVTSAIFASEFYFENNVSVNIKIIDEDESQELNNLFRSVASATNVLAFPVGDFVFPFNNSSTELGDLAICMPIINRESIDQGKDCKAHLAHMVIHGTLHLIGFDHDTKKSAGKMELLEKLVMEELGFLDPYL
ncbi:MAG: rRNA maturation RNase YbeY [Pseudomonadota bacterium]|nr:rRNA maturation RNase YbeY [Pseudomonadota bacterium]